jgi:methionine-rich copper-binding protein CopC
MTHRKILGGLLLSLAATAVLAHAHLKKAVPVDGGVLSATPGNVVLTFSEPARLTACWLQKGAGLKQKITGLATAPAQEISVPVPQMEAGSYVLSWRVVGDDGHVLPGQIHFTVSGAQ